MGRVPQAPLFRLNKRPTPKGKIFSADITSFRSFDDIPVGWHARLEVKR
jgi:hypothetical protein